MVKYLLAGTSSSSPTFDSSNTVTVFGRDVPGAAVNVERQELSSGLTHYLSKIILTQVTVRQVPESGSSLLVRSASPFDNHYLLAGVPFLAPYHFGGSPYADIDGTMISSLKDVTVNVDRVAGRYLDVSGALIEANPGICRPADRLLTRRPELSADISIMSQDFLLSLPEGKDNDDFFQLGFTWADAYDIRWLYDFSTTSSPKAFRITTLCKRNICAFPITAEPT